ncbi:MAG: OmpH family outer membrane protein [Terriglobales bacterium]
MRNAIVAICLGAAVTLSAAWAQTPAPPPAAPSLPGPPTVTGPTKIAFIDFQQAIGETAQGAKLVAGLKTRFGPEQAQLQKESTSIQALQKQLSAGGATMSADAKLQLSQQIQAKQRDLQQAAQNAQSDYQSAAEDVVNRIGTTMMPLIRAYANQHGYTLVVDAGIRWPQSPMLYVQQGTDITAAIVARYNQAHPLAAGH